MTIGMNRLIEHTGPARLGRRTKELVRRLGSDDIAIIDHTDIDRVSAEELVESGVRVVVNVAPSQSGRYPNPGPLLLVRGGVRLIDVAGRRALRGGLGRRAADRSAARASSGTAPASRPAARSTSASSRRRSLEQQGRVTEALQDFADNTLRYLREEGALLDRGDRLPAAPDRLPRPARARRRARARATSATSGSCARTCATSGPCSSRSTAAPRRCCEEGWKPDVIVGDMDSVTDATLRCGAEILVHAYREGPRARARSGCGASASRSRPSPRRGSRRTSRCCSPTSSGAELIVAVGTHFNLVEFLERSRAGMSSTFVTRLKVGEILIDAKGVSRLVSRRIGVWPLVAFGLAALAALVVAVLASPALRNVLGLG